MQIKPSFESTTTFSRISYRYNLDKDLYSQLMLLSKDEFLISVYRHSVKTKFKHRFKKTTMKVGNDLYYDFMKRHGDLRLKTTESTRPPAFKVQLVSIKNGSIGFTWNSLN